MTHFGRVLVSFAFLVIGCSGFLVRSMYGLRISALLMTIFVIPCFTSRFLAVSSPPTQTMDPSLVLGPSSSSSVIGIVLEF